MTDPRTDSIIAAVCARYPGARVVIQNRPDPETIPVPDFLIILKASRDELHEVRQYALELMFATFKGELTPFCVSAADPATAEEYLKGPPDYEAMARLPVSARRGP